MVLPRDSLQLLFHLFIQSVYCFSIKNNSLSAQTRQEESNIKSASEIGSGLPRLTLCGGGHSPCHSVSIPGFACPPIQTHPQLSATLDVCFFSSHFLHCGLLHRAACMSYLSFLISDILLMYNHLSCILEGHRDVLSLKPKSRSLLHSFLPNLIIDVNIVPPPLPKNLFSFSFMVLYYLLQ